MERVCDLWAKEKFNLIKETSSKNVSFLPFICIFLMNLLHRNINLLLWKFKFMKLLLRKETFTASITY